MCELLGNLPFDRPPSEKDRKILVDALIKAFPVAAKGMATVSRVCKQQVKRLNVRTHASRAMPTKPLKIQKRKYRATSAALVTSAEFEPKSLPLLPVRSRQYLTHLKARMGIPVAQLCVLLKCKSMI